MGGNAFEGLVRLEKKAFLEYEAEVIGWLSEKFEKTAPTKYFTSKDSFGDLDVLVEKPKLDRAEFEDWLSSKGVDPQTEIKYNSDVISFKFKDFQTDLIFVPTQFFETAQFYYSYNDLNNLAGRISHKFGVKFGWDGLTYQIRTEGGQRAKKIQLSTCPRSIYEFLDLDYDRWLNGFETLEDIFAFIESSKYFNPTIYAFENLNNINRTRNRKRKTYQEFITRLENKEYATYYEFCRDKSAYLIKIQNAFPEGDVLGELKKFAEESKKHDERKEKFNGKLVMELTGATGPEVGKLIGEFKREIEAIFGQSFDECIDTRSIKQVRLMYLDFLKNGRTKND